MLVLPYNSDENFGDGHSFGGSVKLNSLIFKIPLHPNISVSTKGSGY